MSDCWKTYNCLESEGYNLKEHFVNHSYNFVNPNTGVSTQNIEKVWRDT